MQRGVVCKSDCPAMHLETRNRQVTGVQMAQGFAAAGSVLIAAGAWTDSLLAQTHWRPGICPVRGQMVLLHTIEPLLRNVLLNGARYVVPRPDGHVLIGSTEENAGFNKQTTAEAVEQLLHFGCDLVPGLKAASVERSWAGLRPGTPDGLPYIGRVPGFDNLYVAAGHFRAGIQLSPATGLVMKELIMGQRLSVPLEDFRIDRRLLA